MLDNAETKVMGENVCLANGKGENRLFEESRKRVYNVVVGSLCVTRSI